MISPMKAELDEQLKKEKARETLSQIKLEMGLLYSEIEEQANGLNVDKTIGKKSDLEADESIDADTGKNDE